ncbi:MAG: class I SAM-dependent methyltransferase [Clostridia bacterium]|nr:class I SAM-dependent methyltransferase [Clostridia bacterium]
MRKYYEAYDERYRRIHEKGYTWVFDVPTPIVLETLIEQGIGKDEPILELGCGEGRDARRVLEAGYALTASDISKEAIAFLKRELPEFEESFIVLDCVNGEHSEKYAFIYAVALLHMLVEDGDRAAFYRFIRDHLKEGGLALVLSMESRGFEIRTDPAEAFELREKEHFSGKVSVAATSCRTVSAGEFEREIELCGLFTVKSGVTEAPPEFDRLLYALIRPKK